MEPTATTTTAAPVVPAATTSTAPQPTTPTPTTTTTTDLEQAVVAQVNYYFSPKNLARDDFLQRHIKGNAQGFVPLSVLVTFPKLKMLCADVGKLAEALRRSDQLTVSEDGTMVRSAVDRSAIFDGPVRIGTYAFRHANHMRVFFRDVLHRYDYEMKLSEADQKSVLELLTKYHVAAKAKMGSGVDHVKVGTNAQFPGTKCFVLVRTDGTSEDFSYLKCVDSAFAGVRSSKDSGKSAAGSLAEQTESSAKFSPVIEVVVTPKDEGDAPVIKEAVQAYFGKFGDILAVGEKKDEGVSGKSNTFHVLFRTFQSAAAAALASGDLPSEHTLSPKLTATAVRIPAAQSVVTAPMPTKAGKTIATSTTTTTTTDAAANARTFEKGLVVRCDGVPAKAALHDLKKHFGMFGTVGYVELGEPTAAAADTITAYVRFKDASVVAAVMQAGEEVAVTTSSGGASTAPQQRQHTLLGSPVTLKVVEGDEELRYYQSLWDHLDSPKKRKFDGGGGGGGRGGKRGRGGRGRGGRGRGRGGRGRGRGRGRRSGGDGDSDNDGWKFRVGFFLPQVTTLEPTLTPYVILLCCVCVFSVVQRR